MESGEWSMENNRALLGVLSPEGAFKSGEVRDLRKHIHGGSIIFGATSVRFQLLGTKKVTPKQLVWIEQHKEALNVHQKIDLKKILDEK